MSIRTKIILSFIVPFVIIMAVLGIFGPNYVSNTIKDQIFNHLQTATQSRARHVETVIEMYKQRARSLTSKTWLRKYLKSYLETGDEEYKTQVEDILADVQAENPNFLHISIINPEGQIIISTNKNSVGEDVSNQDFFINGKKSYTISDLHEPEDDGSRLHIAGPLIQDGELLGVVAVASDGKAIESAVAEYTGLGETGEIYLVNKEGYMITPSRFREDTFLKEKANSLQTRSCFEEHIEGYSPVEMEEHTEIYFDYRGEKVLGIHAYIPEMQWCLLAEIDESEALATSKQLVIIISLMLIGFILIYIIFAFWLANRIAKPIKDLQQGAEIIAKGNLDHKVGTKSKNEIGQLSRAFDEMTVAIKKSRAEVDIKVEEQTKDIKQKEQNLESQQKAILNVLEDVEQEKDKTAQEKNRIETIMQSIGDGVFVIDQNYKIIIFNKVASDISGFTSEQALGKRYDKVLKFVFEDTDKINDKFVKQSFATSQVQEMTNHTVIITKLGKKIPVADSAAPLKDKSGKVTGCVVVFRDVTKERKIDQAKTEFVSLASHQLRTPLSAINWYTEMLLSGDAGKLTKEQKKYLDTIYTGNQRMVDLVNALLNVSRIELGTLAIEPEPTDLTKIITSVIGELEPEIQTKELNVSKEFDENLPAISTDPKLIRIVFQNIISNAVKYTPAKGKVDVGLTKQNSDLLFSVTDTGYGIPKQQQSKIFTKLFRADNVMEKDTDGTGLGLYVVKYIVQEAGGKIWFESQENKGTTFYVTIPIKGMKKKEGAKELTA